MSVPMPGWGALVPPHEAPTQLDCSHQDSYIVVPMNAEQKSGNEPPPAQIRGIGTGCKSSFAAALGFFCSLFNWYTLGAFGVTGRYPGMGMRAFGAICWLGCDCGFLGVVMISGFPRCFN